jgi:hypothetical protein
MSHKGYKKKYLVSILDREMSQKDQNLLIHKEPSSKPNQQLKLYSLYGQSTNDQDHSIQWYEHDIKANP